MSTLNDPLKIINKRTRRRPNPPKGPGRRKQEARQFVAKKPATLQEGKKKRSQEERRLGAAKKRSLRHVRGNINANARHSQTAEPRHSRKGRPATARETPLPCPDPATEEPSPHRPTALHRPLPRHSAQKKGSATADVSRRRLRWESPLSSCRSAAAAIFIVYGSKICDANLRPNEDRVARSQPLPPPRNCCCGCGRDAAGLGYAAPPAAPPHAPPPASFLPGGGGVSGCSAGETQ